MRDLVDALVPGITRYTCVHVGHFRYAPRIKVTVVVRGCNGDRGGLHRDMDSMALHDHATEATDHRPHVGCLKACYVCSSTLVGCFSRWWRRRRADTPLQGPCAMIPKSMRVHGCDASCCCPPPLEASPLTAFPWAVQPWGRPAAGRRHTQSVSENTTLNR